MWTWHFAILLGLFPFLESKPLGLSETNNLNRFLGEVSRCARVPALALSLVQDGQIVYAHGFGTINKQKPQPASSKSIFCLGDITQGFTATLLAKLLDEHQNFTWDTPVQEILGAAVHFGDRYRNRYLSLRDILSMRTGLSNMDAVVETNALDRQRLIRNIRFIPEVATFREKYVHNDLLFVLAEEVARQLGRQTWYKLVRDHILKPLGMTNTYFINTDARNKQNLAQPVMSYNGQPMTIPVEALKGREVNAAGSAICSTAEDMGKWLLFNINKGVTQNGRQILPPDIMDELFSAQVTRGQGNAKVQGFSQPDIQVSYTRDANTLGWINGQYRGFKVLSQDGSLPGYESLVSFLPDRKLGVFVAFTGDKGAKAYAAKTLVNIYALDQLIHGHPWFSVSSFCQTLDQLVSVASDGHINTAGGLREVAEPKRPLQDFVGFYRNLAFGDVRVWENETLFMKYGDMGTFALRPTIRENVFMMESMPGPMWYATHADAQVDRPYIAYFDETPYSDERIEELTIPMFDGTTDPVFSKRVRIPPPFEDVSECNSGAMIPFSTFVFSITIFSYLF